jgi:N-acetylneuraminic acid mutarotase
MAKVISRVDYLIENWLVLDRIRWDQSRKYTRVRMRTLRFLLSCLLGCLPGFIGLSSTALAQTPVAGEWAWMSGSNAGQYSEQSAVYGTLGVPAPGNTPGVRDYPLSWTDTKGNLWLFGGYADSSTGWINLNDLWKFDPATNEWSWVSGSSTVGSNCPILGNSPVPNCGRSGMYGTLGTPADGNTPGGRYQAQSWVDSSGNFWLYGGLGFDGAGNWGALNDLWRFNPSTNQWTWMAGSSTIPATGCYGCILGQPSVPGTLGIPAQGNTPGGLSGAVAWSDKNGNLWLFGGWGYTPSGGAGFPNDLWEFNTSSNQWAWIGGDSAFGGDGPVAGTYGVLGELAAGNFPGWRGSEATWTDANGNFWLFGGQGYAASGTEGVLNDLWEFNPSTNMWAWMGGSSTLNCTPPPQSLCNQPGVYGTQGVPATGNIPGSRIDSFHWTDGKGNFWMFGGAGYDASNFNFLNDLWEFSPAKNEWVWIGGSTLGSEPPAGVYGRLGTPAPGNQPGGRTDGANWTDNSGNLWLLGGYGFDANGNSGYLNDLWLYQLSPSFTVTGTPLTIAAGATTGNTSTITVSPTGGFTGSVTLTAALTTSPNGVTAPPTLSFNSTSPLAISGNAAATGTLTIATAASSSKTCTSFNDVPSRGSWYAGSGAVLASLFLFVIPRRSRAWRAIFSLILSFVALSGGLVACSSGGGGGAGCPAILIPGTTTGNYIITVTATSGTITKTETVTVTVQ